jgi:hypothetical protein
MQVLHLPPRHLWRITAVAALLAVALTGIIILAIGEIGSGGQSSAGSGAGVSSGPVAAPAEHVRVPLSPRTVFNSPLRNPLDELQTTASSNAAGELS